MRHKLLRLLKRKFSNSAPVLAVRPHVPWYVRWTLALPIILAACGLVWWAYDSGLEFAGFFRAQAEQEIAELNTQITTLKSENAQLASQVASYERQAQIERAINQEIIQQLQGVNEENLRLKEDLTLFQNLTVADTREGDLAIQQFLIERDILPGEYRYRLLLVQGGQQRVKPFIGHMQLLANVVRNGVRSVVVFPRESPAAENAGPDVTYQLNFKYYLRIQRSFQLPEDALVESIEVRIFERGSSEPRIKQSVNLSFGKGENNVQ